MAKRRAPDPKIAKPGRRPKTAGHGEGTIFKRGNRWCAELMVGVDPTTGKRRIWRATGALRREVADALAKAREEHGRGALRPPSSETFAQYVPLWLASKQPGTRPSTYANYVLNTKRLSLHLGHWKLTDIDEDAIEAAYAKLLGAGLRGKVLSRRSVEQAHSVLHNALGDAVPRRLIRNPCATVEVPRPARGAMQTLAEAEAEALFAATVGTRWHALWLLFVTTGLRLGEATGLRWREVQLDRRRVVVNRALGRVAGEGLRIGETKNSSSRRTVPIPLRLVRALEAHRAIQAAERAATSGWPEQGLVFPSARGTPIDPARVREQLRRDLAAARGPDVRVHDLRHTCATLLLTRNVHPKIVQELLGHSTIAITLDLYSHVIPALSGVVADHMEELFPSPLEEIPATFLQSFPESAPLEPSEPLSDG